MKGNSQNRLLYITWKKNKEKKKIHIKSKNAE